jgi:ribosomal protein L19
MLTLMREHHVPSLSMYDGIIIPRSKSGLAQTTLKRVFKEVVGVEPVLTIETAEPGPMDAGDL